MGKKIVGFKANKRCAAVCDDSPLHPSPYSLGTETPIGH